MLGDRSERERLYINGQYFTPCYLIVCYFPSFHNNNNKKINWALVLQRTTEQKQNNSIIK